MTAWPGELLATKLPHECLQYIQKLEWMPGDQVIGSEDCLYLHVYVPEREDDNSPLPVLFWIHGGAFMFGSANSFGPKYVMDKDVILVSVNYRVGPLGKISITNNN